MKVYLNRKHRFAASIDEMDRTIESLNRFLDEKVDVGSEDYMENISTILNFQAPDGSFNLLDSFKVESDVRVDFCFMPTYLCTAILMKAYLHGEEDLQTKVRQALPDALKACTWRGLRGHGFEAFASQIKAIKIFMKGGIREFVAYHNDISPEFTDMLSLIKEEYRNMVEKQAFYGSWGESYEEGIKAVDEYLSHSNAFVYGTLLAGERNHDYYLSDSPCIGRATLTGYDMYDIGSFPGIVLGEGEVLGEVYEVSDETLKDLDYLEGEGSLYIRKLAGVTLETGEKILASIYIYNRNIDGLETIPVWLQPYTSEWKNKMNDYVWYVAYGSNMLYERFMCYINGTKFRGRGRKPAACADQTEPRATMTIDIPHNMYFGNHSGSWDDGGVSFLDVNNPGHALCVAYLITREQFEHICREENSGHEPEDCPDWYNFVATLGEIDGYKAVTITNSGKRPFSPPADSYREVLIEGLLEHYPEMGVGGAIKYLGECENNR